MTRMDPDAWSHVRGPHLEADPDGGPDAIVVEGEWNGRHCPYYARYYELPGHDPEAVCGGGCVDEPACITDEPLNGWPRA